MVLAPAITGSAAHAAITDLACNYDYITFNACLHFAGTGQENYLRANIGLDAFESLADAQQDALTPPRAWLYGRDNNGNVRFIAEVPRSSTPVVAASGEAA